MKVLKLLGSHLWQLPQHLVALAWYGIIRKSIVRSEVRDNFRLFITNGNGGVALGKYVYVGDRIDLEDVVLHESGHVKQSMILGPLYLLIVGIPSIIHAMVHKKACKTKDYYHFWTESWANKLASRL